MSDTWWLKGSRPLESALPAQVDNWWLKGSRPLEQAQPAAAAPETPPEPRSYAASEVPGEALSNFVPSLIKQGREMVEGVEQAVTHPVDTSTSLLKLLTSVGPLGAILRATPGIMDAVGVAPETANKIKELSLSVDEPLKAVTSDFAKTYGGWDAIKRTAAEDPARLLMDLGSVLSLGGGAAAKAPGVVGKIGAAAKTTGDLIDPVSLAAKGVTKGVAPLISSHVGVTSGVGATPLKEAAEAGFKGGADALDFKAAFRGEIPLEDIITRGKQNIDAMKQRMFASYQADKDIWEKSNQRLSFSAIDQAESDVVNSIMSNTGNKVKFKLADPEINKINELLDVVSEWRNDPTAHTVLGLDDLKQAIRNRVNYKTDNSQVVRAAQKLAEAAQSTALSAAHPKYRDAMKNYAQAANAVDELEKTFSLGRKGETQSALTKLQSAMRNNAYTQWGYRDKMLSRLGDEGGANMRPLLAGASLNSWEPRGLARIGMSGGAPTALSWLMGGPAAAIATGLGEAALSIPKISGGLFYGAGRAAGIPDRVAEMVTGAMGRPAPRPGFFYRGFGKGPRDVARYGGYGVEGEEEQP